MNTSLLQTFRHCTEEIPTKAGLFRKRLDVLGMSFKLQYDVTSFIATTDVTFDHFLVVNDVKAAGAFKTVTLLFHITRCFDIGYIGEVCSNS